MANEDSGTVLVRPLKIFMGQPGEGQGQDGLVMPDQAPFRVSRQRLADLKANGLVEEAGAARDGGEAPAAPADSPAAAPAPITTDSVARSEDARGTRGRPART
ncbi:hypothetical protein HNR00_003578 [Methylorubrum rhodinum]|uniref:Uncharacterized protein n=1 Tax=Methylorubrum rhodinum TaxID=29428 RepID=A0A840ZPP6_9HYPH|nr:hypothetical protein [Methylorubrum rhodinum]MBB5758851.1 hypothetical protein [Methylorubrum rhodinum]